MKQLIIFNGTMGVGKTTLSQALKQALPAAVFLDGDWCWDGHPFQVNEETKAMVIDNICYALNNFLSCSAYDNIIFCWVMHEQSIIDTILNNLHTENCIVHCISLTTDPDTLIKRLSKDVESGIRNREVIDRSVARLPLYQNLNTIKVDTTDKSIEDIIKEIRAL